VKLGIENGIGLPAFSASLATTTATAASACPGNLIQAQRDYFGAHTYERNEAPGKFIHTQWSPEQPAKEVPTTGTGATQVGTREQPKGD
jgi:6-phosphogluconate dehydrogenase